MKENKKERQSPEAALQFLKDGNKRFQSNLRLNRDLLDEAHQTAGGQNPFATVLSCIDSRVSSELIFDQGMGDLFSIRVAGNIVNEDILGSMEFANAVSTSKVIVVLGHTKCGAVGAACNNSRFDHLPKLNELIIEIEKSVKAVEFPKEVDQRNTTNEKFFDDVVRKNVELAIKNLKKGSPALAEMANDPSKLIIIGGVHDISNGEVNFFNE